MSPTATAEQGSERRVQRRIEVGLPIVVRGTDREGERFEDTAQSYNVSRTGASFSTLRQLEVGMEVELSIPRPGTRREPETDFVTLARVVRVLPEKKDRGRIVGVQFVGPRFHRVFVSESTA